MAAEPILLKDRGEGSARLGVAEGMGPVDLAATRIEQVARAELGCRVERLSGPGWADGARVVAVCPPWDNAAKVVLREAGLELTREGGIAALDGRPYGDQGFVAARAGSRGERLVLASDTAVGLRNALLTLSDRLYKDAAGNVVVDPCDGVHAPAFLERHLKSDAMFCGAFNLSIDYWDPTTRAGVDEFTDWLASFRISDYDLLAFVRGWGTSYASARFPALANPLHPNVANEFYPRLLDRLHDWGMRVWASDVYLASGYSMETGTCPEMLSPGVDRSRLQPYVAGERSFRETLYADGAIACLSHPAAATYYAEVVQDLLDHYPSLDGLDFHIGHAFPRRICRCPECVGLVGNRQNVYACFARVYETAVARCPDIRMKTAVKMFGDATRLIVDRAAEFPQLEFFCWLRWVGQWLIETADAPVTIGHEDGGGGLEAGYHDTSGMDAKRAQGRDYEPWIRTYVDVTREAKLPSVSWEPAMQRELEQQFFLYSQLTWEPELTWAECARRYVIRSERRQDPELTEAYRLALELNAAVTSWGIRDDESGVALHVVQPRQWEQTPSFSGKLDALEARLGRLGVGDVARELAPVGFDLRWSLAKAAARLRSGKGHYGGH